jgi:hypothetical protein
VITLLGCSCENAALQSGATEISAELLFVEMHNCHRADYQPMAVAAITKSLHAVLRNVESYSSNS